MRHSVVLDHKRCRAAPPASRAAPPRPSGCAAGKAAILQRPLHRLRQRASRCAPTRPSSPSATRMDILKRFRYCVALPEPALYGQFHNLDDVDIVLNGLLEIGFHDVYEVAKAAELLTDYQRQCITGGRRAGHAPDQLRLPHGAAPHPHALPQAHPQHRAGPITPVELAAILARREAEEKTGLPPEEIGVFSIVPCSSKVTAARTPDGLNRPVLDGAFAIRDVYLRLLSPMRELRGRSCGPCPPPASWAWAGPPAAASPPPGWASGTWRWTASANVIRMLEEIEDGRLPEADFLELTACAQGCVGGCFTVENPYGARMRIKKPDEGPAGVPQPLHLHGGGPGCGEAGLSRCSICPPVRAGPGPGGRHGEAGRDRGAGAAAARAPLRLLRRPLLPRLCRGRGAGPGQRWRTASSRCGSGCSTWPAPPTPTTTCPPPSVAQEGADAAGRGSRRQLKTMCTGGSAMSCYARIRRRLFP